jgi:hypothetical protein
MTGGSERSQLVGSDQFLMIVFLYIHPCAQADEIATFIVNNGGGLYDRQTIQERLSELDFTRTRSSTEAYQALLPHNIAREQQFLTLPPPLGVAGIQRRKLKDLDECSIYMEQCNPIYGYSHKMIRIRKAGHYVKGKKITIICAVEPGDPTLQANVDGSVENPRRYWKIYREGGTTQVRFAAFVDHVLQQLELSGLQNDNDRILMWDNLQSHLTPFIYQTVYGRPSPNRFRIVRRPPYQPKYGPIEYILLNLPSDYSK